MTKRLTIIFIIFLTQQYHSFAQTKLLSKNDFRKGNWLFVYADLLSGLDTIGYDSIWIITDNSLIRILMSEFTGDEDRQGDGPHEYNIGLYKDHKIVNDYLFNDPSVFSLGKIKEYLKPATYKMIYCENNYRKKNIVDSLKKVNAIYTEWNSIGTELTKDAYSFSVYTWADTTLPIQDYKTWSGPLCEIVANKFRQTFPDINPTRITSQTCGGPNQICTTFSLKKPYTIDLKQISGIKLIRQSGLQPKCGVTIFTLN